MPRKNYEVIEHTADIGIRVRGNTQEDLFKNAALAIFDIIAEKLPTDKQKTAPSKNIIVQQKADNPQELFINWLNELLSLSSAKEIIFESFKIDRINENNIKAEAKGFDIKNYKVNTEIKAATYHALKLKKAKSGWLAEVILDV